jgi:hypothetical protein
MKTGMAEGEASDKEQKRETNRLRVRVKLDPALVKAEVRLDGIPEAVGVVERVGDGPADGFDPVMSRHATLEPDGA